VSILEVTDSIAIPHSELQLSFSRSSGPGGQNVNKVNSKVTLTWNFAQSTALRLHIKKRLIEQNKSKIASGELIVIQSEKYREQKRNILDCHDKLAAIIKKASYAPKKRLNTNPSKSSIEKRIKTKKSRSEVKKNRSKVAY
tara:strand:+ start:1763 stop:2185 length:423 start_codon:yes stop_codon:yes gene_type:complete